MKKVKTLLSIFLCIMACALFGACSCAGTNISVVSIAIAEVSANLVKEEGTGKYLVRKGETFTITYEIKPGNASDLTTYVDITPANKITSDMSIFRTNNAKNTVEFKASSLNIGESLVTFQTRDGSSTISILVEIIDDTMVFSEPQNLKYGYNPTTGLNEFTWDKSTVETNNGRVDATKYAIFINDERFETDTNSYAIELQSATDYYVRLQALGELKNRTSDSQITSDKRFYIASTPKNLKASKGVLTWEYDDEDNINQFILEFDRYSVVLDKEVRTFDLAEYIKQQEITGLGSFNVKLTAVNTDFANGAPNDGNIFTYILNSRNNPTFALTQLYSPRNLRLQAQKQPGDIYASSMLTWDSVTNASSYLLTVYKNGHELGQMTTGQNVINLSKAEFVKDAVLSQTSGEYTIKITPQGDDKTFIQSTDFALFDFVVTPFLYGNVNYTNDKLNLLTADLLTMLNLTTDDLNSKLKYEVYYTEDITGHYDHTTTINSPTTEITLSEVIDLSGAYNILVRPVPSESYTTKNVVLPMLDQIQFNKSTTSMITQLKEVIISNVDTNGLLTGLDENPTTSVDKYKYVLTTPTTSIEQIIYRNNQNLVFDGTEFTISLVDLFNIQVAGDYSIKIIPMSDSKIDANPTYCTNYLFKQLADVDTSTIEIDNNVITWDNVANYSSYTIKINDEEEVVVNSNSYTVEDNSILLDNNTITIKVNGNGTNTISSNAVSVTKSRAMVVSGFKVEDGVLTWEDSVANSTYYITITYPQENVEKVTVNTNSYSGLDKIATSADITISRGVPTAFNSEESETISINRLVAPTNDMEIVNHSSTAKFTVVENANKYKITIKNGSTIVKEYLISTVDSTATIVDTKVEFAIATLEAGNYAIYIQAIPSDQDSTDYETNNAFYLISNISQNNDFVVYPKVEITNKTHTLDWTFSSTYDVKEYTIHFENDEYEDIVTTSNNHTFQDIDAGEYSIVISASSTSDNVIYSEGTITTIVKTETPIIAYNVGKVEFELVSTASEYKVYNSGDTLLVAEQDYEINIVENTAYITPLDLQEGVTYSIYIVAIGDTDVLDGDKSNSVEFSIIDSINEISMTTIEGKKVFTWDEVQGNAGYLITLSSSDATLETYTASTNSYAIPDKYFIGESKLNEGVYSISVVVLSDTLLNSNPVSANFIKLGTISNTDLNDNIITWNYIDEGTPTAYKLSVVEYIDEVWTEVKTVTITNVTGVNPTYDLNELNEYNNYRILITAVGADTSFTLDGEISTFTFKYGVENENTTDTFTRIEVPTFSFNNGRLQLIGNVETESYELYSVNGTDYTLLTYEYTMDSDRYINLVDTNTSYVIVAKAIALGSIGKLNSEYSEEITINKLAAITDLSVDSSGLISWTANENATNYVVHNLTTGQSLVLEGVATNSVSYDYLYTQFELELSSTNEFAVQVIGNTKNNINYLNSELSNSITINAVDNISIISLNDGLLNWDDISGVSSYRITLEKSNGDTLKNVVVNTNSYNLNNCTEIANGNNVLVKIIPYSTINTSYIIADAVAATSFAVQRYNIIKAISVENGLIKFELDIKGINTSDIQQILTTEDYSTLSDEIQQKYYGYYNFRLNVNGTNINITLNDTKYEINLLDIAQGKFYTTYQLQYDVSTTTLLNIQISSIGNSVNNLVDYGAIGSIPSESNNTILKAYKHSAPVGVTNNNLISEKGEIKFQKIEGVTDYILTAKSVSFEIDETLTFDFTTDGTSGEYSLGNASAIKFKTNTNQEKNVHGDTEYVYTLTTLGSKSWASGNVPYLRSNAYTTTSILFLSKPELNYEYSSSNTSGGHISWDENDEAQGYRLYALNVNDANLSYTSQEIESVKANVEWLNNPNVYTCDLTSDKTSYRFEDGGFTRIVGAQTEVGLNSGSYWVAVQVLGDDNIFITPAGCNNTIVVYKVNEVNNARLQDGAFSWKVHNADEDFITGFRISISVFGNEEKVIELPSLMGIKSGTDVLYTYTLDEQITDATNTTHNLWGVNNEAYGISIIAIGGNYSSRSCVNSAPVNIDNNGSGYKRLDVSQLSVDGNSLVWTRANNQNAEISADDVNGYTLFIDDTEIKTFDNVTSILSFSDSIFNSSGDYPLKIKAMAKSNKYLSSIKSEVLTAVKFENPEIIAKNGEFDWWNTNNGQTHQPLSSTLTIMSSDGTNDISQVFKGETSAFNYSLDNSTLYPEGYYTAKVYYNGHYDQANQIYYISSNESSLTSYKLGTPVIEDVANFTTIGQKECQEYDSCLKWQIIKDESGNIIKEYKITISVFDGVEYVVDNDLSRVIDDVTNTNYYGSICVYKEDTGYVYYNLSDFGNNGEFNSLVKISVVAQGEHKINSSPSIKEINYSKEAPQIETGELDYGIIRWSGSDNPIYVTLLYQSNQSVVEENIYLDTNYIETYGQVYYLPYMARYESVQVRFVIDGCYLSNISSVAVGVQTLFSDGDGSDENPYLIKEFVANQGTENQRTISVEEQLQNIQYRPLSHIKIANGISSITLNNTWTTLERFGGVFDGNGVTINNIKFVSQQLSGENIIYRSLFKDVLEGAVIKNLTLSYNVEMGTSGSTVAKAIQLSGVATNNEGTIDNITMLGTMTVYNQTSVEYGAVALYNYGIINKVNSSVSLTINGDYNDSAISSRLIAGGITCYNYGLVDLCGNSGAINMAKGSMQTRLSGGITVYNVGVILNSQFTGSLTAYSMAGIAVENHHDESTIEISKMYSQDATPTTYEYSLGHILGCYSTGTFALSGGTASHDIYFAGIVGYNNGGTIGRCYAIFNSNTIMNFANTNTPYVYIGGLVAFNSYKDNVAPSIENSYVIMNSRFTATSNKSSMGAIVGTYASGYNYGESYTLSNVIYYSSTIGAFGGSINITDTEYLYALSNSDDIKNATSKLNEVSNSDKYAHIRTFYADDFGVSLIQTKTITN